MSIPWNGNWKWKLDRYKKLLSHAFNKPDDSLFKWYYRLGRAVSNQAQSPCPRISGEKSEIPTAKKKNSILLSWRPDLKARARVGKEWNKKWLKKIKRKVKKRKVTCQKILYYHGTWANCTRRLCCKQTALPDSCENFTLNRQPTSALITTSSATSRKICSKSASQRQFCL